MKKILKKVKEVARKAGAEAMKFYNRDNQVVSKKDKTFVTEVDFLCEKIILKELSDFGYGFLSEEKLGSKNRVNQERVWVIDPIDGTMDYIKKTGEFSIMIGLVEKGRPILGVVYQPAIDKLYFATSGGGAFLEESGVVTRLEVSKNSNFSEASMLGSRHHVKKLDISLCESLGITDFISHGSAGLKICLIAEQKADVYINSSNKTAEWDICAADIILSEAGGTLTDLSGKVIDYNKKQYINLDGYVVSNAILHEKIIGSIRNIRK